jgi:hypothetical protein
MKIASFSRVRNANAQWAMPMEKEFAMTNVVIIFIFESQVRVWSPVELRHEFGPLYKFHIHNL